MYINHKKKSVVKKIKKNKSTFHCINFIIENEQVILEILLDGFLTKQTFIIVMKFIQNQNFNNKDNSNAVKLKKNLFLRCTFLK